MKRPAGGDQPQVPTREQRQQQPVGEPTMSQRLNGLYNLWKAKKLKPGDNRTWDQLKESFGDFCCQQLKTARDMTKVDSWTIDAIAVCAEALGTK